MKENFEEEQQLEMSIQPLAGVPGVPGATATNYLIHPNANINTFTGGAQAFFSRPGVCYNEGGASNIGQYANFTDGNSGFLIYSENGASGVNLAVRKKSKTDTAWSERVVLYHSGNFNTSLYASATSVNAKADKTYVDTGLASKTSQSYVDNALANKADKSALDAKADKSALNAKADKTYVDEKVATQNNTQLLEEMNDTILSLINRVGNLERKVNLG